MTDDDTRTTNDQSAMTGPVIRDSPFNSPKFAWSSLGWPGSSASEPPETRGSGSSLRSTPATLTCNFELQPFVISPVRLIREVTRPGGSGPFNGQYALQKALRGRRPQWLKIGGTLRDGEIPWFWCWEDRDAAAACALTGRPLIVGPNVLFEHSRRPCRLPAERDILDAASCRLIFTESAWYRDLIERHRGNDNRAPIVLWPYPINPKPGGPLPAEHDVLVYAKSAYRRGLVARLERHIPRLRLLIYGQFARQELFDAARRSRCCLYLSDDDRGPLALAEILLAGCPAIGVPTGAPFIEHGRTGVLLESFRPAACIEAVASCQQLDRHTVAAAANEQFDTARIVDTVLTALHYAAQRSEAETAQSGAPRSEGRSHCTY